MGIMKWLLVAWWLSDRPHLSYQISWNALTSGS
jgi:hypothetical protein